MIQELMETEQSDEKLASLKRAFDELEKALKNKLDNIDEVLLSLETRKNIIQAKMDVLIKETDRLRTRRKILDNTKRYFNGILMPNIIKEIGKDGKLKTSTANYTSYKTYELGDVDISKLDKKYIKEEIKVKIDKRTLKKDALAKIKNKENIDGCELKESWRTRRS